MFVSGYSETVISSHIFDYWYWGDAQRHEQSAKIAHLIARRKQTLDSKPVRCRLRSRYKVVGMDHGLRHYIKVKLYEFTGVWFGLV